MTADSTSVDTVASTRRPLPVDIEWLDLTGPLPVVFIRQKPWRARISGACCSLIGQSNWRGIRSRLRVFGASGVRNASLIRKSYVVNRTSQSAFTLLELLIVLAIIGLLAGLTLPHLRGFTKANAMQVATRQLLDDVSFARQRAMANRSPVYMVFIPPEPWNYLSTLNQASIAGKAFTNLILGQYRGYALISTRSVGDQPGNPHPSYLTDWRTLPNGVFFATNQFVYKNIPSNNFPVYTTNLLSSVINTSIVTIIPDTITRTFPFPTLQFQTNGLPYIGFSPSGSLIDENGNIVNDQYIALTSGGIIYPLDTNGVPVTTADAMVSESPAGEWTNNATLIHIDATTARAKIEHNQF